MDMNRLCFTLDEAAAATGYNRCRLYKAINEGTLRSFKDGRRRMVSRKALEDFIALRERQSLGKAA